jgi:hypothetical protein
MERDTEILYQEHPWGVGTYTRHRDRSFTTSLASYQGGAGEEVAILRWNGRVPNAEIVLHLLTEYSSVEIKVLRSRIFRYLKDHGLEAVANIELTLGTDGKPNNTVHFHVLTDDKRSLEELWILFETACKRQGLVKDKNFCIRCSVLWNGDWYFNYFTKYRYSEEVILFQKGIRMQKFYQIGRWYAKGRGKGVIWGEIQAYMKEKDGSHPGTVDELPIELTGECPEVDLDAIDNCA